MVIAYGEGAPKRPVATDILQDDEYLVNNRDFVMHPRGVKWTGAAPVASTSPTNTELENPLGWERVYEKKNVRLLELKTNG